MDIYIYLRKSRKDEDAERKALLDGESYDTLQRHRDRLLAFAQQQQYSILEIYEEVVSGENIVDRPMMQQLLRNVQNGNVNGVLVVDLERLGRGDLFDSGMIDRAFRESETLIITPMETYDPTEESWELIFGVKSIISRQELKAITRRMQLGRIDSIKQGKHVGKRPPYGYLRNDKLKLIPDKQTKWIIEKIFEMTANGIGRINIARELDKLGVIPPQSGHSKRKNEIGWRSSTVSEIIKNEVYKGDLVWGKMKTVKQNGKKKRVPVPSEEWTIVENAHEPIVSKELFAAANIATQKRYRPNTVADKSLKNPLAGILECEICGHALVRFKPKDRPNEQIRCTQTNCIGKQKGALLPLVEQRLLDGINEFVKSFQSKETKKSNDKYTKQIAVLENLLTKANEELIDLNIQKDNTYTYLEKGIYSIEVFQERQKKISSEISEVENKIQQLSSDLHKAKHNQNNMESYIPQLIEVLKAYRKTDSIEKKNRLLKSVLEKATFLRTQEMKHKSEFIIQIYPKIKA